MDSNARDWFEVHYFNPTLNQTIVIENFSTYLEAVTWADTNISPGTKFFVYGVKRRLFKDLISSSLDP